MTAYWQMYNWNTETFRDGIIHADTIEQAKAQAQAIMPQRFDDTEWEDMPAASFSYKKAGKHHFYLDMNPRTIPGELTN